MLLYAVGIGFLLIFGVLISDALSGSSARASSITAPAESSKTRKSDDAAKATSPTQRPRTVEARRPADGLGRAA